MLNRRPATLSRLPSVHTRTRTNRSRLCERISQSRPWTPCAYYRAHGLDKQTGHWTSAWCHRNLGRWPMSDRRLLMLLRARESIDAVQPRGEPWIRVPGRKASLSGCRVAVCICWDERVMSQCVSRQDTLVIGSNLEKITGWRQSRRVSLRPAVSVSMSLCRPDEDFPNRNCERQIMLAKTLKWFMDAIGHRTRVAIDSLVLSYIILAGRSQYTLRWTQQVNNQLGHKSISINM